MIGFAVVIIVYIAVAGLVFWDLKESRISNRMKAVYILMWPVVGIWIIAILINGLIRFKAYR